MKQTAQPPAPPAQPGKPIVVQVVKQPPVAREIGMGDVVLGAVGLTGAIILAAIIAGLIAGVAIIGFRHWRERQRDDGDAPVRLRT